MRSTLSGILLALALVGSITLSHGPSTPTMTISPVEVALGPLLAGSSVGANATNGSVTFAGATSLLTTTDLLYLNNTNASRTYYVKLMEYSSTGLALATTINIGVNNGTANTDQVLVSLGAVTQSSGPYVPLPPGTTGKIYASTLVSVVYGTGMIGFEVLVADDASETAYYSMRSVVTVT